MNTSYEETLSEFKKLMRCQLMALPNGRELYKKILPYMRESLRSELFLKSQLKDCLRMGRSTIDCWCIWSDTNEGGDFWNFYDAEILCLMQKKKTPWLTSPHPTFIEVEE